MPMQEVGAHDAAGRSWPTTIQFSSIYFQSLMQHAVPLNEAAVAHLSHSAMALDVYTWLAHWYRLPFVIGLLVLHRLQLLEKRLQALLIDLARHALTGSLITQARILGS